MEPLAIISHNFFRANGFVKSRSPSSPYGPAPQGSQLIMMGDSPRIAQVIFEVQGLPKYILLLGGQNVSSVITQN